jgi:hypothetical protein
VNHRTPEDLNRETQKKKEKKKKEKTGGNNRSQPSLDGGGKSMQRTETDPIQDSTQQGKLLQKGRPGKKRAKGKDKTSQG